MQAEVEFVEERNEVLTIDWPGGAPLTLAQFVTSHRIDEDLIESGFVEPLGVGVDAWLDE